MKFLFTILISVFSITAKSQSIVIYLDSMLRCENPNLKIDTNVIYMVGNAMALDKGRLIALDEGIGLINIKSDIIKLEYVSKEDNKIVRNSVALIKVTLKGLQSKDEIKSSFEKAKLIFDTCTTTCPVVFFNDAMLDPTLCKKELKKLKLKKIKAITFKENPLPNLIYGEKIKYGLVKIWTK